MATEDDAIDAIRAYVRAEYWARLCPMSHNARAIEAREQAYGNMLQIATGFRDIFQAGESLGVGTPHLNKDIRFIEGKKPVVKKSVRKRLSIDDYISNSVPVSISQDKPTKKKTNSKRVSLFKQM